MNSYFAQGMRCGHPDGKTRIGQYVAGEEYLIEGLEQGYGPEGEQQFADGYASGYQHGAAGEPLPSEAVNARLPLLAYAIVNRSGDYFAGPCQWVADPADAITFRTEELAAIIVRDFTPLTTKVEKL